MGAYENRIARDGAVGYWRLSGTSSPLTSSAGNSPMLVTEGASSFYYGQQIETTNRSGIRVNGTGHDVSSVSVPLTTTINASIECWVRFTSVAVDQVFAYCGNSNTNGVGFYLQSGVLTLLHGGVAVRSFGWSPSINTTYHLATHNAGGAGNGLWVNGVRTGNTPEGSGNVPTTSSFATTSSFQGYISDVAFYNYPVGESTWVAHYTAGINQFNEYEELIINDNPVLYLPLDDSTGTTAVSVAGSNGTYVGSPTLGVVGPTVVGSTGVGLSGSNQYATVPDAANLSTHAGASGVQTIECWIKQTAAVGSNEAWSCKGNPVGPAYEWLCLTDSSNRLDCAVTTSGGTHVMRAIGGTVVQNQWHHVVVVYNRVAPSITIYQDGVSVASSTSASGTSSDTNGLLYVGTRNDAIGSLDWTGHLAALAVYDYALTAEQVQSHYTASPIFRLKETQKRASSVALAPVLSLPLDDADKGVTARSFVGDRGVYIGTPTRTSGPSAVLDGAVQNDGGTDYVRVADASYLRPEGGPWSVFMWINYIGGSQFQYFTAKRQAAGDFEQYAIGVGNPFTSGAGTTLFGLHRQATATQRHKQGTITLTAGWHHVGYTYNGAGVLTLYLDGVADTGAAPFAGQTDAGNPVVNNTDPLLVSANNETIYNVTASDLAIYNRSLTATEVAQAYNYGRGKLGPGIYTGADSPIVLG